MRKILSVLSGMALIAVSYGMVRFGFGLYVPAFAAAFGLGDGALGPARSRQLRRLLRSRGGRGCAHRRPRLTVALAGACAVCGSLGIALATSTGWLAGAVVLAGSGAGFASPGLVGLVEQVVDVRRQATAQAVVNSGTGIGIVAASALAMAAGDQWRVAWGTVAALSGAVTVATLVTANGVRSSTPTPSRLGVATVLRALWLPVAPAVLAGVASAAMWTFGRAVVLEAAAPGSSAGVWFWTLIGAGGLAGAVSGDLTRCLGVRRAWVLMTVLIGLSTVLAGASGQALPALVGAVVFGASYVAMSGVPIAWAELSDASTSGGVAVLFIALAGGQAIGSAAVGVLSAEWGSAPAFATAAAVALASVACVMWRGPAPAPAARCEKVRA